MVCLSFNTSFRRANKKRNRNSTKHHNLTKKDVFLDGDIALAYRPTPATVRVTALLGDLCSKNSDCLILNSYCVAGACTCLPDYYASNDRQNCIGKTSLRSIQLLHPRRDR